MTLLFADLLRGASGRWALVDEMRNDVRVVPSGAEMSPRIRASAMRNGNGRPMAQLTRAPLGAEGNRRAFLGPVPIKPETPAAIDTGTAVFGKSLRLRSISGPDYALWPGNADIAEREKPPADSIAVHDMNEECIMCYAGV
jgi:hypothetical protein